MARNYFKFGSYANTDFGIVLISPITFPSPAERGEAVPIPGRDGSVWKSEGAWDEVIAVAQMWIPQVSAADLTAIRAWLAGSGVLETSATATSYYNARIASGLVIAPRDLRMGYDATLTINAAPFPFVKSPTDIVVSSSPSTVPNAYPVFSLPLLEIDGTGDVEIVVGATTFTLTGLDAVTWLDCATGECYTAGGLANDLMEGAFPTLVPGDNVISWSGTGSITSITISPRWRTL